MDKKEASFILANIDRRVCDDELNEAFDMAIKALEQEPKTDTWSIKDVANTFKKHGLIVEQEPCEDAIDRKIISAFLSGLISDETERKKALQYVNELPPVTPQPKTGHWLDDNENEIDAQYGRHLYKCSKCDEYANAFVGSTEDWWDLEKPNYCPNCGRRMVEPQERSEEE